jgi:TetR/AcrR family transcriptional regulator, cholesterol catabolism regulator
MVVKVRNIADRSREIFMKYGIRSVSMDDISRELGMSKKTLYQHFLNKSDLVKQVLLFNQEDFERKISNILNENHNAVDDLLYISLIINSHIEEVNLAFTFDLQKYYPDLYREFLDKKRNFASHYLTNNILKGIRENLYRNDLNVELLAKLYVQKIEDLHDPQFYDKEKISFGEVFQVMFENHIRGIANENGIKYFEDRKKTLKLDAR